MAGHLRFLASRPDYAMCAHAPAPGAVIGKSLGSLSEGIGVTPVLITLQ